MKIDIHMNRDCVSIEDTSDHSKTFVVKKNATYMDLFKMLIKYKYMPCQSDSNAVWVLTTTECFCVCSYYVKTKKFYKGLLEEKLISITKSSPDMYLRYYSSPLVWKDRITKEYHGQTYDMWKDGWLDECQYCDYVMSL